MTKKITLKAIEDPGHGWLKVPTGYLDLLGIADKITGYSYISPCRQFAYLEEDVDFATFMNAAESKGWEVDIEFTYVSGNCSIRRYQRYV